MLVSFAAIFIILNAGYYKEWFAAKPVTYWSDFQKEKDDTLDQAGILRQRYGIVYTMSMRVKDVMIQKKVAHPVILFEPNSFYRDSLHVYPNIHAPEPALFYYYTGLEGVWTNSPDVGKANFLLTMSKKGIKLQQITSPQQLQVILAFYKKYPPSL